MKELKMPSYTYDCIQLRSREAEATVRYYNAMFDTEIVESVQPDGRNRIDLNVNGLTVFIVRVSPDDHIPAAPSEPYLLESG